MNFEGGSAILFIILTINEIMDDILKRRFVIEFSNSFLQRSGRMNERVYEEEVNRQRELLLIVLNSEWL